MSEFSDLTAFIFARGGSKGIKNKNIREAGGKPLIAHAISCGLESQSISRVVVSTDDKDIAGTAQDHGAEILERPADLAADDTPEILAWRHALDSFPDIFTGNSAQPFISLPATSPLRVSEDVDAALSRFGEGDCDMVFGITPAHRNPYLNMVTIDEKDLIHIALKGSDAARRQDVPAMYDVTTCVYVGDAAYIQACEKLMDGRVGYVEIPPQRALDIDTSYDLYLANLMLKEPFET